MAKDILYDQKAREALLKGEAALEAMLRRPGEMPEINRTGNTDFIF